MPEQIIPIVAWAGLVVLAILCLPVARKFVLELSAWAPAPGDARLARGRSLPVVPAGRDARGRVEDARRRAVAALDSARSVGIALRHLRRVARRVGASCLLLATLDVTRKLAGRRLQRFAS